MARSSSPSGGAGVAEPGPGARSEPWRDAVCLAAAAFAVRALVACLAVAVTKDGTIYLEAAQAAARGDGVGLLLPTYHPLTSSWCAIPLALGFSAEPWAALFAALLAAPGAAFIYLLGRDGWTRYTGLLAGGMFACAPALARTGGVVLSYGPHLTCVLAALWFGARFLRPNASAGWAWAAGIAAGVGFNARPEALGALIVFALVATWRGWRLPAGERRGRLAFGLALCTLGVIAAAAPTVTHSSTVWGSFAISRKKRVGALLPTERVSNDMAMQAQGHEGRGLSAVAAKLPGDLWETVHEGTQAWHLWLALLGLAGAALFWGEPNLPGQADARRLCALGAFAWLGLGFLVRFAFDYLSDRHVLPFGALLLPWSAAGLRVGATFLNRWLGQRAHHMLIGVTAIILLAKTVVPMEGRRAAEVELGRGIAAAASLPPGALVISNLPRVTYYAGARASFIPKHADSATVLAFARGLGATVLIFDVDDVALTHPGLAETFAATPPLARTPEGSADDFRAYAIGAE